MTFIVRWCFLLSDRYRSQMEHFQYFKQDVVWILVKKVMSYLQLKCPVINALFNWTGSVQYPTTLFRNLTLKALTWHLILHRISQMYRLYAMQLVHKYIFASNATEEQNCVNLKDLMLLSNKPIKLFQTCVPKTKQTQDFVLFSTVQST